jgi:hypothetical protein
MSEVEDDLPTASRGPAYPYIPLPKVMERVEKVSADGLMRMEVNPVSYYKSWGYNKENGNARQTMAALNHFGLVEYIGRGKDRKVKLSKLSLRILLDKIPGSRERAAALREAALQPAVYLALWNKFEHSIVPDHVMETFLTLELEFTEEAARKVIAGYRDTFSFANLGGSDSLTDIEPPVTPADPVATNEADVVKPVAPAPSAFGLEKEVTMQTSTTHSSVNAVLPLANENEIKVMLDGAFLRVSAVVDARGAKKLMKALAANIALLEDDDDDDGPTN